MSDRATPEPIVQIGPCFLASKTPLSAIELGLITPLTDGGWTAPQIAARLDLHERSHDNVLDALVWLGPNHPRRRSAR